MFRLLVIILAYIFCLQKTSLIHGSLNYGFTVLETLAEFTLVGSTGNGKMQVLMLSWTETAEDKREQSVKFENKRTRNHLIKQHSYSLTRILLTYLLSFTIWHHHTWCSEHAFTDTVVLIQTLGGRKYEERTIEGSHTCMLCLISKSVHNICVHLKVENIDLLNKSHNAQAIKL